MSKRHTITLNDEAFERLKEKGVFGETYSQVVARLAKFTETIKDSDTKT
jgi:predicted CopG family antitoxin